MATTGRLTAPQRAAILAGNPIRQSWYIHVPIDSVHSGYSATLIDDGVFQVPPTIFQRVIRAGSRSHVVWNPSPNVAQTPKAVQYSFVVDNNDGRFYENNANNFYKLGATYQAIPQECYVRHLIFVAIKGSTPGAISWSQLTHMAFEGQIKDVRHEDTGGPDGTIIGATTTITSEQKGAWDVLRRDWTIDDGTHSPMTNGAVDYDWTIT